MHKKRNQHYIPQFYFRFFSTDGKSICLVRREDGSDVKQAAIRGQASRKNFYGNNEVEKRLAAIEAQCSSSLRKLIEAGDTQNLELQDALRVTAWLALQRSRTAAAREAGRPMQDKLLRLQLEVGINNDQRLDTERRQLLLDSLPFIGADMALAQLVEMDVALQSAAHLEDLDSVLLINQTNRPFIFGDAPVVLYNGYYRKVRHRGVLGFDTPGLMMFFPLTPRMLLMRFDKARYRLKRLRGGRLNVRELKDVAALNKLQIHCSSSCIYFHDYRFAPYVSDLWRQEQSRLRSNVATIVEGLSFTEGGGESAGDMIQAFQPQLPFVLMLTFLQHQVLGDEQYRPARRSTEWVFGGDR